MSITLKRTASHFFSESDEAVIEISVIKFPEGDEALHIGNGANTVLIHSSKQLNDLINALRSVGSATFE